MVGVLTTKTETKLALIPMVHPPTQIDLKKDLKFLKTALRESKDKLELSSVMLSS